jgi:hypothetical protein
MFFLLANLADVRSIKSHLNFKIMFYFLQVIELKNQPGRLIFLREENESLVFRKGTGIEIFKKSDFKKEDVIELYESVKLFGKIHIIRILRANF